MMLQLGLALLNINGAPLQTKKNATCCASDLMYCLWPWTL